MTTPTLTNVFKERMTHYKKVTKQLFKMASHVTEAVEELISKEELQFLKWQSIDKFGKLVVIIGAIKFPIGHEVVIDETGVKVVITEENQESIMQMVRLAIPYNLVKNQDKDKVREYLKKNSNFGNPNPLQEGFIPVENNGFDLSQMTDDQVQRLIWFQHCEGKMAN